MFRPPFLPTLVALAILLTASPHLLGQREFYELAPIKYSDTESNDPMARLAADWNAGRRERPKGKPLEVLRTVLKQLEIPEESQVLVYSRTSQQNNLIRYKNPRMRYKERKVELAPEWLETLDAYLAQ